MNIVREMNSSNHKERVYFRKNYNLRLTDKQLDFVKTKYQENTNPVIEKKFSRQEGATTACAIKAIEEALAKPNRIIRYISVGYNPLQLAAKKTLELLNNRDVLDMVSLLDGRTLIRFNNGSTIYFNNGNNSHILHGCRVDVAIVDTHSLRRECMDTLLAMTLEKKESYVLIAKQ